MSKSQPPALLDFIYPGATPRLSAALSNELSARRALLIAGFAISTHHLIPVYSPDKATPLNADAKLLEACIYGVNKRPRSGASWVKPVRERIQQIGQMTWEKYIAAETEKGPQNRGYYRRPTRLVDVTLSQEDDRLIPLLVHGMMRKYFPHAEMAKVIVPDRPPVSQPE